MLTYDDAKVRVGAIAQARPDHKADDECIYINRDGTPSCLVGTALVDELKALGITYGSPDNGTSIAVLTLSGKIDATPKALLFLQFAQDEQDGAQTWSEAFAKAVREVEPCYTEDGKFFYPSEGIDLDDTDN